MSYSPMFNCRGEHQGLALLELLTDVSAYTKIPYNTGEQAAVVQRESAISDGMRSKEGKKDFKDEAPV